MSEQPDSYDVYFAGECLEGHAPDAVRAGMQKLFKADEATLERLFSGKRQRIKRGCDKQTALSFQKAMTAAGARPIITRSAEASAAPAGAASEASTTASPATTAAAGATSLSLAPPGSDVLSDEERKPQPSVAMDLDYLSVEEPGARLSSEEPAAAPLEAPDFDLAETGTDLLTPGPETPVAAPDTSSITLAEPNHDFSDCQPPPAAPPEVSTDLSLAAAGSDILTEEERHSDEAAPPDTSHLALEPEQDQDKPFS